MLWAWHAAPGCGWGKVVFESPCVLADRDAGHCGMGRTALQQSPVYNDG
jgi:hypothetical protein